MSTITVADYNFNCYVPTFSHTACFGMNKLKSVVWLKGCAEPHFFEHCPFSIS